MANSQTQWSALEHQVYRFLRSHQIQNKSCWLAISGGADSMALLKILAKLAPALKLQVSVGHVHHGPASSKEQDQYREAVLKFVKQQCEALEVPFFAAKSEKVLPSENDMREFRQHSFQKWKAQHEVDFIFWAHHAEDFLETQILRMIRGSGKEATLRPMQDFSGSNVRPFLQNTKSELLAYLRDQNFEWIEDPSNQDESYLRNWIRNRWLCDLEQKCPGALKSFARSLDLLQESHNDSISEEIWLQNGISRTIFLTLNESQKRQVLAIYIRDQGVREFTQNHLKEIIKHLDISQLNHTFKSAQLVWTLSKELISAKASFVVNAN